LTGIDESDGGLFAPPMRSTPSGYSFIITVFDPSRLFSGPTNALSAGLASIIGARRCLLQSWPISIVGSTESAGPGL
jgi:hypothetical protein